MYINELLYILDPEDYKVSSHIASLQTTKAQKVLMGYKATDFIGVDFDLFVSAGFEGNRQSYLKLKAYLQQRQALVSQYPLDIMDMIELRVLEIHECLEILPNLAGDEFERIKSFASRIIFDFYRKVGTARFLVEADFKLFDVESTIEALLSEELNRDSVGWRGVNLLDAADMLESRKPKMVYVDPYTGEPFPTYDPRGRAIAPPLEDNIRGTLAGLRSGDIHPLTKGTILHTKALHALADEAKGTLWEVIDYEVQFGDLDSFDPYYNPDKQPKPNPIAPHVRFQKVKASGNPHLDLFHKLSSLPSPQFSQVVITSGCPSGIIPGTLAAQSTRAIALLEWAKGPSGCGMSDFTGVVDMVIESCKN